MLESFSGTTGRAATTARTLPATIQEASESENEHDTTPGPCIDFDADDGFKRRHTATPLSRPADGDRVTPARKRSHAPPAAPALPVVPDRYDRSQVHIDAHSIAEIVAPDGTTDKDVVAALRPDAWNTDPAFSTPPPVGDTSQLNMDLLLEQMRHMNVLLDADPKFVSPRLRDVRVPVSQEPGRAATGQSKGTAKDEDVFVATWRFWLDFMAAFPHHTDDEDLRALVHHIQTQGIPEALRQYVYPILSASTRVLASDPLGSKGLRRTAARKGSAASGHSGKESRLGDLTTAFLARLKPPSTSAVASQSPLCLLDVYREARLLASKYDRIILLDINRTFPGHPFFDGVTGTHQQEASMKLNKEEGQQPPDVLSPSRQALFHLCRAYANYDPPVGYCQGMSVFFGLLMMTHLPAEDTFVLAVRLFLLFNVRSLYHPTLHGLREFFPIFGHLLRQHNRRLASHFRAIGLLPDTYLATWLLTFFTTLFPVPLCLRLLDLLLVFGPPILYKIPLAIMMLHGKTILERCPDFEQVLYFFKHDLPRLYHFDCALVPEEPSSPHGRLGLPSLSTSKGNNGTGASGSTKECVANGGFSDDTAKMAFANGSPGGASAPSSGRRSNGVSSGAGSFSASSSNTGAADSRFARDIGPLSKRLLNEIVALPLQLDYLKKLQEEYKTWFSEQDGRFTIL